MDFLPITDYIPSSFEIMQNSRWSCLTHTLKKNKFINLYIHFFASLNQSYAMKKELISSLEPLLVCFMMFAYPYEFHVHSKPWSKLNQSKMVPQSQLIQLFIQRSCLKKRNSFLSTQKRSHHLKSQIKRNELTIYKKKQNKNQTK